MMKTIIQTETAPAAIGTYSQAVRVDNTVYISGQIPLDPKTMTLVSGDFHTQVKRTFDNLQSIVIAAGGRLSQIVKLQIFLIDLDQFAIVNKVMAAYFESPYPARVTIQVSRLPKEAAIEIDAVLFLGRDD